MAVEHCRNGLREEEGADNENLFLLLRSGFLRLSQSGGVEGLLFVVVYGLLTAVASLVKHRL